MTFSDDLTRFVVGTRRLTQETYVGLAAAVHASVVDGSPVTGAPGQPVDTGNLKGSWILDIGVNEAEIRTNVAYAEAIEDGVRPGGGAITFRSTTGGAHSVKLTVAGASRLQDDVVRALGGGA